MPVIRILVVDDWPEWQRFLRRKLESERNFQIVGLASNGLEGVGQAAELQPDVVLMDLNMPVLNGIDATRRIRELSPRSRVLFLSENRCREVVWAAFEAGACGYVVKADSGSDLVAGIRALLENKQFLSSSLRDQQDR
jgi:DNA-binding NarL/FixJ family response regulator